MSNKKTIIILFLCCCSCASKSPIKEDRSFIYLTNNSKYFLLPSENIENSLDMPQRISASWQGKELIFNAWVKADESGMEMILLNEFGVNIGELSYQNGLVAFSSTLLFPKSLKSEYIVADFQLCFYNTPALRNALKDCGLTFENTGNTRRIFQGKNVIIEIEKNKNNIRLINHLRGYTYTLEGNFE